ncbi:MAG: hypothetical protein Tsb0020_03950 [Haliangiales bacterium]
MTKPTSTPKDTPEKAASSPAASSSSPPLPSGSSLVALTALGFASALWALFLWAELLLTRAGGEAFCNVAEGTNCVAVWDSGFASSVHDLTGLPVAGWGLVWSLVAALLPLWALKQRADGGADGSGDKLRGSVGAVKLTAAAGAAGVLVFLIVSAGVGQLCLGCLVTYVLTLAYAGVALAGWRGISGAGLKRAAVPAVAIAAVSYVALLYPGTATPKSAKSETDAVLETISSVSSANGAGEAQGQATGQAASQATGHTTSQTADQHAHDGHAHDGHAHGGHAHGASPAAGQAAGGAQEIPTDPDERLALLMKQMPPQYATLMASALRDYKAAPDVEQRPVRSLHGPKDAPVRITDFTDVLCSHCANLYRAFDELKGQVPEGSYSIEPRQFPLDGACNPTIPNKSSGESVRCTAAKAQICLEDSPHGHEFASKLFANQRQLRSVDKIYELAAPYIDRQRLDACMANPATDSKLLTDITYAKEHDLHGTPLVLINGRKASAFPLFLFAMILTGGDADHPAFASLPEPPPPSAHNHAH